MQFNKEVDARGLHCPLPILKAKKALDEMITGEVLKVISTDPGSVRDSKPSLSKRAMSYWRMKK